MEAEGGKRREGGAEEVNETIRGKLWMSDRNETREEE